MSTDGQTDINFERAAGCWLLLAAAGCCWLLLLLPPPLLLLLVPSRAALSCNPDLLMVRFTLIY